MGYTRDLLEILKATWEIFITGFTSFQIIEKLKLLKKKLKAAFYYDQFYKVQEAEVALILVQGQLHQNPFDTSLAQHGRDVAAKYRDDNTGLFHRSIKQRRIHNRVNSLLINGCSVTDPYKYNKLSKKFMLVSFIIS